MTDQMTDALTNWICEARNQWHAQHEENWLEDSDNNPHPDLFMAQFVAARLRTLSEPAISEAALAETLVPFITASLSTMSNPLCCVCRKPVDTRENGTPGAELTDGRWACSADCWDRATALSEQQGAILFIHRDREPCSDGCCGGCAYEPYTRPQPAAGDAVREGLSWLRRALECPDFKWDPQQQDAAGIAYQAALDAVSEPAPVCTSSRNLSTSDGGRRYVAEYFIKNLRRHDLTRYITTTLAADFACALAGHLAAAPAPVVPEVDVEGACDCPLCEAPQSEGNGHV